jgi:hypothetical protein
MIVFWCYGVMAYMMLIKLIGILEVWVIFSFVSYFILLQYFVHLLLVELHLCTFF